MKPILMVLGLLLAAGAGAVGGILAAPRATRAPVDAFVDARPAPSTTTTVSPEIEKRLQSLNLEVSGLQAEIAALREERTRMPADQAHSASGDKLASAETTTAMVAALHRDAILKVLADERAAQEKAREEERKQREAKMNEARADRAAQKLGLSAGQRQTLVDYYAAERAHVEEVRAQFRDGTVEAGRDAKRDALRDGREWRTNELTRLFGTDLGAQIDDFENEGFRERGAAVGIQRVRGSGPGGGEGPGGGGGAPPVPRAGGGGR